MGTKKAVTSSAAPTQPEGFTPAHFGEGGNDNATPPPAPAAPPAPVEEYSKSHSDYAAVHGGLWLSLVTGKIHGTVEMFMDDPEGKKDEDGNVIKVDIPLDDREIGPPIGPYTFHAVKITPGLADPPPPITNPYEHPGQFPTEETVNAMRVLLANSAPQATIEAVLGDPVAPKNDKDRVLFLLSNRSLSHSPMVQVEPGQWAIDAMADPALIKTRIKDWVRYAGLQ